MLQNQPQKNSLKERTKVALASSQNYIPVTTAGALTPITQNAPAYFCQFIVQPALICQNRSESK
jgi:hypothetical protein